MRPVAQEIPTESRDDAQELIVPNTFDVSPKDPGDEQWTTVRR